MGRLLPCNARPHARSFEIVASAARSAILNEGKMAPLPAEVPKLKAGHGEGAHGEGGGRSAGTPTDGGGARKAGGGGILAARAEPPQP